VHREAQSLMATVVLLNGVGSAGKSSIAKALQAIAGEPLLHLRMDDFLAMLPQAYLDHPEGFSFKPGGEQGEPVVAIEAGPVGRRLMLGMRRAIAAMAKAGNNLIVDDVLLGGGIDDYRKLLGGHRLHVVGVFAPLDVLERRERRRGDRMIGLARWQFDRVHGGIDYDLWLDTGSATPQECARRIKERFDL
jgi:chloramphenicol 3-O phosphotransferase